MGIVKQISTLPSLSFFFNRFLLLSMVATSDFKDMQYFRISCSFSCRKEILSVLLILSSSSVNGKKRKKQLHQGDFKQMNAFLKRMQDTAWKITHFHNYDRKGPHLIQNPKICMSFFQNKFSHKFPVIKSLQGSLLSWKLHLYTLGEAFWWWCFSLCLSFSPSLM